MVFLDIWIVLTFLNHYQVFVQQAAIMERVDGLLEIYYSWENGWIACVSRSCWSLMMAVSWVCAVWLFLPSSIKLGYFRTVCLEVVVLSDIYDRLLFGPHFECIYRLFCRIWAISAWVWARIASSLVLAVRRWSLKIRCIDSVLVGTSIKLQIVRVHLLVHIETLIVLDAVFILRVVINFSITLISLFWVKHRIGSLASQWDGISFENLLEVSSFFQLKYWWPLLFTSFQALYDYFLQIKGNIVAKAWVGYGNSYLSLEIYFWFAVVKGSFPMQ